uniref:CCHC-type domain-containing protein n=1 Tax=Myripristis murdjan TaxID=586833 RepID=A0A667XFM0_9TELE
MTGGEDIESLTQLFSALHTNDHQTGMEQMMQVLLETQRAQQETNAALLQQQIKANQLKEQELRQSARVKPKAGDFIPKLGGTDDVEAYLHAFEATAAREGWPKAQWVGLLAPFLSGEALNAFQDLEADIAQDYDILKDEILSRHGLTKFSMAQRYHNWSFQNGQTPRSQMHELIRVTKKWLEPDKKSPAAIVETLVMDRYLRALPYEAKKIISHQKLTTAMELVEAVEQYQAASDMLRPSRKEPVVPAQARPSGLRQKCTKPDPPQSSPPKRGGSQTGQPRGSPNSASRQCYRCGELGHISWQCEKPDEPMPTAESTSGPQVHFAAFLGESEDRRPTC